MKTVQFRGMCGWIIIFVETNLSDFLHQVDIKSLNSAKSLNNLIPGKCSCFIQQHETVKTFHFKRGSRFFRDIAEVPEEE